MTEYERIQEENKAFIEATWQRRLARKLREAEQNEAK